MGLFRDSDSSLIVAPESGLAVGEVKNVLGAVSAAHSANPEGHLAAAAAAGVALTKNQKKKLKKKLKKVGSAPTDSEADSQQTGHDSDVTSGAAVTASAESGKAPSMI